MERLRQRVREVLIKIYVGQNIRSEGILQREIEEKEETRILLSKGLIKENHWHLHQFLTTEEGSQIGSTLIKNRISEKMTELEDMLKEIPEKVLGFFVKRYVSESLIFSTQKPWQIEFWTNRILHDSRIWILHDRFFASLNKLGLCVKTHNYVSTRGGELRELCYVISPEIQEFLVNNFSLTYFTSEQESTLNLYSFLTSIAGILSSEDIDFIRQRFYELLIRYSLTEEQIAGFIRETSKRGITSNYDGLLSESKPFNVKDTSRFKIYLAKSIIEPAINLLLEKGSSDTLQRRNFDVYQRLKPNLEYWKTRNLVVSIS